MSPSPGNGQSLDSGSSCPLPRAKAHAWACRSLLALSHSPQVQQVPVSLGKFKVVSLQGSQHTWTSAKWRASKTPFRRLMGHAQHSAVSYFALAPLLLPAKNAKLACQNPVCLFQGSAHMPASSLQGLTGCPPPRGEIPSASSTLPWLVPYLFLSGASAAGSQLYLRDIWSFSLLRSLMSHLCSPAPSSTGLCMEQVFNPGLEVLLAELPPALSRASFFGTPVAHISHGQATASHIAPPLFVGWREAKQGNS